MFVMYFAFYLKHPYIISVQMIAVKSKMFATEFGNQLKSHDFLCKYRLEVWLRCVKGSVDHNCPLQDWGNTLGSGGPCYNSGCGTGSFCSFS